MSSLMSNIDEIKDKITDREYLVLCNLLKFLNDEIKNPSNEETEDDSDTEDDTDTDDEDIPLDQSIRNFLEHILEECANNEELMGDSMRLKEYTLGRFNSYIRTIHIQERDNESDEFFICPCGCSVRIRCIPDHINDPLHSLHFSI